jgi:trimeric autotransporter adhesin
MSYGFCEPPVQITQATNNNSVFGYATQRPNATGVSPVMTGGLEDRLGSYINPAAFSTAARGTFGNIARTLGMRGPGQANWDLWCYSRASRSRKSSRRSPAPKP